jgi:hypothetical protein
MYKVFVHIKGESEEAGAKTYRNHEFWGLELPEGDIDGDTTLTLGL